MFRLNGWETMTLKYGKQMLAAFGRPGGHVLRRWIANCENARYSALIEGFTSTTYAMVIVSDPAIQPATTLLNIEASRAHFESLINNMSNFGASAVVNSSIGTIQGGAESQPAPLAGSA